ncbi:MAG: MFS transporter [Alphaproteobacteria bacterium]|nr:MFS transporter [Alphaproteobacteria bacterium]
MSFRSVFRHRPFATMWTGRLFTQIANLTLSIGLGWWVYALARRTYDERTSAFLVGMIGLAQFLPMFVLALVAGATADRYDRRIILFSCGLLQSLCAASFTVLSFQPHPALAAIFATASLLGIARAFSMPAGTALLPALVPWEVLPRAISWNTLSVQGGMVIGPLLGGWLTAISIHVATGTALALYLCANVTGLMLLSMNIDAKPQHTGASRLTMIKEGLAYLWSSKIVFGAISLDLFAVLLGGVTSLLPVFARDILHTGPEGFGHLRAAFALGAGAMTLCLAAKPIVRHAGKWMMGAVIVYGIATVCFALSRNVALSMLMMVIGGIADSVSVFVRQNLVQIVTPNAMRGRVSAVSGLFISASNELGEFESGVMARLLGVVGSAVFGGVGSILVTLLWGKLFPALRKADRIEPPKI